MLTMTPKQTALASLPLRSHGVARVKALRPLVLLVQCLYVLLVHAVFAVMALLPPPKGRYVPVRSIMHGASVWFSGGGVECFTVHRGLCLTRTVIRLVCDTLGM